MKHTILLIYLIAFAISKSFAQDTDNLNLSALLQPADSSLFIHDKDYFNWCSSIIKEKDGTYHLFYSRWSKKLGFSAWLTHSEIAHAVATSPLGPYVNKKTVLTGRANHWDAITAHNVKVEKFGKKYYMYYTSTNSGNKILLPDTLKEIAKEGYSHPYWDLLRSHQRTGLATSMTINGPWKRKDTPIIEPSSPIKTVTVNPAIAQGPDGDYYFIIKGDDANSPRRRLIQAIGKSKSPEGPFQLSPTPAFKEIPTEDVSMWYDKKRERFYAIFHAHGGDFIGLITSRDGLTWNKAKHYVVCKKEILLKDGTIMKVSRMERPFVYIENDVPLLLSVAVQKGNDSFIVLFPLNNLLL